MISSTLIELIFKAPFLSIRLDFLSSLLENPKEVRFDSPEISSSNDADEITNIFQSNDYVDLVIVTDKLEIDNRVIKNAFINVGRNENELELLFYFDLKDMGVGTNRENIDYLKNWAIEFKKKNNFEYFICQMDNAGAEEYYFDSSGLGPFYEETSR